MQGSQSNLASTSFNNILTQKLNGSMQNLRVKPRFNGEEEELKANESCDISD